ncbi:MAG: chloride channel protein [Planctomycetota bacterium]
MPKPLNPVTGRELHDVTRWVLLSALVGVVAGLGAILFNVALDEVTELALGDVMNHHPPVPRGEQKAGAEAAIGDPGSLRVWAVLLLPTLGGLLAGAIIFRYAPEAEGHGTDAMVKAFHRLKGDIRRRVPLLKSVASIITIGSGGSAGREGPIAQIGAGFGSFLGGLLKLSPRERRLLMLAGAAGGIGAIFRAPLGASLFACEVLYRDAELEAEGLIPSIIASIVSYSIFTSIFGTGFLFETPHLVFRHPYELPFYLLLGLLCAGFGWLYVRVFYGVHHLFGKLSVVRVIKPAIGGLLLGLLALEFPQMLSGGYGYIQEAIDGNIMVTMMLLFATLKILATSLTISSGGSGGVFGPSLFIGAMLGGAVGFWADSQFPELVDDPAAFVLVGMGGFFAGVAKVPIASLIMVSEMTGSYGLLVPLMLVSVIAFLFSRKWTLYIEQVPGRIDSPAHLGDFVIDILEEMTVADILDPDRPIETIPENLPLKRIIPIVAQAEGRYFPVVDAEGRMTGIFSLTDVRRVFHEDAITDLLIAKEIATEDVLTVTPDDDLSVALRKFTLKDINDLPVVDHEDSGKILGMINRKDLFKAYDAKLRQARYES